MFRDQSGAVGLLELHCPHRGTSLEFGLIEAKGIRCCYHGWLFAGDGTILETPGEPMNSTLKDRLYHGVSSLQTLGRPWPDSRTNTWKLLESPRKAIPVGIFRPLANTDAVNPGGRTIDGGKVGLKKALLSPHCGDGVGFATVAAWPTLGNAKNGITANAAATLAGRFGSINSSLCELQRTSVLLDSLCRLHNWGAAYTATHAHARWQPPQKMLREHFLPQKG